MSPYKIAQDTFRALGIDTETAIHTLLTTPISLHCWQGDDVTGFENAGPLTGGIQATGNYPGKATTPDQLMQDIDQALALLPGKHRLNLHAIYAIPERELPPRDQLTVREFQPWIDFAKARGLGLDMNPTYFSHPMMKDNLSLSSPDENVRCFWVEHGKRTREIAQGFADQLGTPSLHNIWIPDGMKDTPADRLGPRLRLQKSLDEILSAKLPGVIDCVESKVFGIGLEAYTVGSNEFYMAYCASREGVYPLCDNGHYHPTEMVSDKLSALLTRFDRIPLHVTRPVRWDSDHVVRLDDELKEIAAELVRTGALSKALIGLDYFDASINRIAAWVVGVRNMQKALLMALLTPWDALKTMQDEGRFTELLLHSEEIKTAPWGIVWDEVCQRAGVPMGASWYNPVVEYEKTVLAKRG